MQTSRIIGIAFALLVAILAAAPMSKAAELDESLLTALQGAARGQMLPVLVVMQEQGVSVAEHSRLEALPLRQRRATGRGILRALAGRSQIDLLNFLGQLERRGEVSSVHSLFMVNGVAFSIAAERVNDLLRFPSVRRVLFDPPIPEEQMIESGPMPNAQNRPALDKEMATNQIWWQLTKVRAPEAWNMGFKGAGVLVGVVDTGVDYNHPDLAGHIFINTGEIPGNGVDDDGNGFIDDVRGWNFVEGTNDPMDQSSGSHGTMVAGIVAGDGTSGIACGVAPEATILPIRAVGGTWSVLFQGLDYAVLMNADIIQLSTTQKWRFNPKPDFAAWRALMDNELALGIFHTNSIGNEGLNQDTDPIPFNIAAPGNCPAPWLHPDQYLVGGVSAVIAVGAISAQSIAADYSSRGPSAWEDLLTLYPEYPYVIPPQYQDYPFSTGLGGLIKPDLCAPGPGTLSTKVGGGYGDFSGTSAASPHVAGAIAICLQADPLLTPGQMDMILETTAGDLGAAGKDNIYGSGLLDVAAAVTMVVNLSQFGIVSGTVRDALSGQLLTGASVDIGLPLAHYRTNALAGYRASLHDGSYVIHTSAFGYVPDTSAITITIPGPAETIHDVNLMPLSTTVLRGRVYSLGGDTLVGAGVSLVGTPLPKAITGIGGSYEIAGVPVGIPLTIEAVKFNYQVERVEISPTPGPADTVNFVLTEGLADDFESDQGWTLDPNDTALVGKWERCAPVGTWSGSIPVQPDADFSPQGTLCYITMNGNPGAGIDFSDVDDGTTTLLSPIFDGRIYVNPVLSYRRWYSNDQGPHVNDVFKVDVSSDGGSTWTNLETVSTSAPSWVERNFNLESAVGLTASMRIRFVASDLGLSSIVEAGVDEVRISPATVAAPENRVLPANLGMEAATPNPFRSATVLRYRVPQVGDVRLSVYDVQGRWVRNLVRGPTSPGYYSIAWDGRDESRRPCAAGVYLYQLTQQGQSRQGRVIYLR